MEVGGFRLTQQLSDPIKYLGTLCPSALPPSVGQHIASRSKMAAAAQIFTQLYLTTKGREQRSSTLMSGGKNFLEA